MPIAMVARQTIMLDTDYSLRVGITGNPREVTVTGDMEYFSFDYQPRQRVVIIRGHPEKELSNLVWFVRTNIDPEPREIVYDVVKPAPIFLPLPALHLYRDVPINIDVPIMNPPDNINGDTLLLGLGITPTTEGAKIDGEIPQNQNFSVSRGDFMLEAAYAGGPVMRDYPYEIEAGAPPVIGTPEFTPKGNYGELTFADVSHAIGYEWTLESGDDVEWQRFGDSRRIIDPGTIEVKPGNLNVTITFRQVTGATRYEYMLESENHNVGWTEFVGTLENEMITTIIPNLEEGVEYTLRLRVSSPWIGSDVSVTVYGALRCIAVSANSTNSAIFIFNTVAKDNIAEASKSFLLPTGNANPSGIAVDGETVYCIDSRDRSVYVFSINTTHGERASLIKTIRLPTLREDPFDIDLFDNKLYIVALHAHNGDNNSSRRAIFTIDPNTADNATANIIDSYRTGSNSIWWNQSSTTAARISVEKNTINFAGVKVGFSRRDEFFSYPRLPLDFDNVAGISPTRLPRSITNADAIDVVGTTRYTVDNNKVYIDNVGDVSLIDNDLPGLFTLPPGLVNTIGLRVGI